MIQPSSDAYQFLPALVMLHVGDKIFFLHQETTSSVSSPRLFLILPTPKSVVCSLSKLESSALFCLMTLLLLR